MAPFTDSDRRKLETQVKEAEGLRLSAYRCTAQYLTIGYGHNCDASPVSGVVKVGDRITQEEAERLFVLDLDQAIAAVRKALPWVFTLNAPRQAVLYDMCFNMGLGSTKAGFLSFSKASLPLIRDGHYERAAQNILESKWARDVKERRAGKLMKQLVTGAWQ